MVEEYCLETRNHQPLDLFGLFSPFCIILNTNIFCLPHLVRRILKALRDEVHGLVRLVLVRLERGLSGDERLVLGPVGESVLEEQKEA